VGERASPVRSVRDPCHGVSQGSGVGAVDQILPFALCQISQASQRVSVPLHDRGGATLFFFSFSIALTTF